MADPTGKQSSSESGMLERSYHGNRTFHLGGKKKYPVLSPSTCLKTGTPILGKKLLRWQ